MKRYEIINKLGNTAQGRQDVSVIDPEIDKRMLFTSTYSKEYGEYLYKQDVHLNRFDLNDDILDEIIDQDASSLMWIIDPRFVTLETAIKMANAGGGKYLSEEYNKIWEIAVLRYLSGERDFYNYNDFYTADRLIHDSDFAAGDLEGYLYNFIIEYDGYLNKEKREYQLEEERKNSEVMTLKRRFKK